MIYLEIQREVEGTLSASAAEQPMANLTEREEGTRFGRVGAIRRRRAESRSIDRGCRPVAALCPR